jgi:hypothetical protein
VTTAVALLAADRFSWDWHKVDRPTEALGQVQLPEGERAALKAALSAELGPPIPNLSAEEQAADFRVKLLDLNGDGIPEVIAQITGRFECGATGNCPFLVFRKSGNAYESILAIERINAYQGFTVTKERTAGYLGLILNQHGSAFQQTVVIYKFRNGKYRASGCYEANWNREDQPPASKEPIVTKCR